MSVAYAASIAARFHGGGGNVPPTRVVIHATVSPCVRGGARAVADYFQSPSAGGSAHVIADPGELVRCLPDDTIAYHAPPNLHSLGIELCDPSTGDPARWADPEHQAMLRLAATQVRSWCDTYSIPVAHIGPPELLAGARGICAHVDVSQAWHQTDHTDPGPGFPWDQFLDLVRGDQGDDDMAFGPDQANQLTGVLMLTTQQQSRMGDVLHYMAADKVPVWYRAYLGRPATQAETNFWVGQVNGGQSLRAVEAAIATSSEAKTYAAKQAKAKKG